MDRAIFGCFNRTLFVHRFADDVQDATQRAIAHRNRDGRARVADRCAAHQAFGRVHSDATDGVLTQVLGDFHHQLLAVVFSDHSVQNRRQRAIELHVDHGADHLRDFAL